MKNKVKQLDGPGYTGTLNSGIGADSESEFVDNTQKYEYSSEEMSGAEKKEAWEQWYESLFNSKDAVLYSENTENGKLIFKLKTNMNVIPKKEIDGGFWPDALPDDIGAERFETDKEWIDAGDILVNGWRI